MVIRETFSISPITGKGFKAFLSVLLLFLFLPSTAHAHKVSLFAWVENDTVYTESYFGGEKKAIGGLIKVYDLSGNQLLEGKTDENGAFSFRIPQKTDLKIVLEATMGHKTEFILKAEDLGAGPESVEVSREKEKPAVLTSSSVETDMAEIRLMMEGVMDARLKPIAKALAKIQQDKGPSFTEIIGGIGYIFGLMGVALYFGSRKKDRPK